MYSTYEMEEMGLSREGACMLESAEIEMSEACATVLACEQLERINMRKAELKCMQEDGDTLALADLYEEAAEKTEEKKDGLLTRAWDKIIKMIESIKKFLFGSKEKKVDMNQEVEVDQGELNALQKCTKFLNEQVLPNAKKMALNILAGLIMNLVGMALQGAAKSVMVKIKKGELFKKQKDMESAVDTLEATAKKSKGSKEANNGKVTQFFNKILSTIKGWCGWLKSKIFGSVGDGETVDPKKTERDYQNKASGMTAEGDANALFNSLKTFTHLDQSKKNAHKSGAKNVTVPDFNKNFKAFCANPNNSKQIDAIAKSKGINREKVIAGLSKKAQKLADTWGLKLEWGFEDMYDFEIFLEDCVSAVEAGLQLYEETADGMDTYNMDEFDESGDLIDDADLASLLAAL